MMEVGVQPQSVGDLILHDLGAKRLEDVQPLKLRRQDVAVGTLHAIGEENPALDPAEASSPVFIEMSLERLFVGLQ